VMRRRQVLLYSTIDFVELLTKAYDIRRIPHELPKFVMIPFSSFTSWVTTAVITAPSRASSILLTPPYFRMTRNAIRVFRARPSSVELFATG
jgi:hypothetical protein